MPRSQAIKAIEAKLSPSERWNRCVDYFRNRGGVVFLSYCPFWQPHGFVQQSLAVNLAKEGVPVLWFDGLVTPGLNRVVPPLPALTVKPMPRLKGQRISFIRSLNRLSERRFLRREMGKMKNNPVIWVQGGIDEQIVNDLPYVDVFSVFDDPYRHSVDGILSAKSKMIICQNSFTYNLFCSNWMQKAFHFLPPIEMGSHLFSNQEPISLPGTFPQKRMGYIGSFYHAGFNLELFAHFVKMLPEWGFILMGSTDAQGENVIKPLRNRKNFLCLPWEPKKFTDRVWKLLDVSLLLYRQPPSQLGGFPTKALESLFFGVPFVGTDIPCTEISKAIFPWVTTPTAFSKAPFKWFARVRHK